MSRKKKQGRARKAKQANETRGNSNNTSSSCVHYHLDRHRNWSRDDIDAANKLAGEYEFKTNLLATKQMDQYEVHHATLVIAVYDKYFQLSDGGKEIFRKIILATGTKHCIIESKQKDLIKEPRFENVFPLIIMMRTIEVRDRYDGALSNSIYAEIRNKADDTVSPRETVRLFHRGNSCDCLKDLYYKLKENTKRTSHCCNCGEIVDIRTMSQCECKQANYCSHHCAVAHYPGHSVYCKQWRTNSESIFRPFVK